MRILTVSIIVAYFCLVANSLQGIQVSNLYSTATYQCLHHAGNFFAVVRGTTGTGQVDDSSIQGLYNAAQAGLLTDVKFTPCRGKNGSIQANQFLQRVYHNFYDTIWVQVMPNLNPGCQWKNHDPQQNCKYMKDMIKTLQRQQKHIGIFSSLQSWKQIFGSQQNCPDLAQYPLWYLSNNKQRDFSDFPHFGGWDFPRMKLFQQDAHLCGVKVNRNFISDA